MWNRKYVGFRQKELKNMKQGLLCINSIRDRSAHILCNPCAAGISALREVGGNSLLFKLAGSSRREKTYRHSEDEARRILPPLSYYLPLRCLPEGARGDVW